MKKKLFALLCVIACILTFTACGNAEYTTVEKNKLENAEQLTNVLIQVAAYYGTEDQLANFTENYGKHECAAILENLTYSMTNGQMGVEAEYGVFEGMLTTYLQASQDMGGIVSVGEYTSTISGKTIIVTVPLEGNNANGTFVCKYTNDIYMKLTAAEVNAKLSFSQNMKKAGKNMGNAGLNTLLGMGTVFTILILISLIISSFNLFKKKPKPVEKAAEAPVSAPVVEEELADDTELVAVIMAAISAYEGANGGSADGFVVRSIRRANRRN